MRGARFIKKKRKKQVQEQLLQLMQLTIGSEILAVDILQIQEVKPHEEYTKVPDSYDFIEGVLLVRGEMVPVIDLRKEFSIGKIENTSKTRIIFAFVHNQIMGFIVDSVLKVINISKKNIYKTSENTKICSDYLKGMTLSKGQRVLLLDLDKVMLKLSERT